MSLKVTLTNDGSQPQSLNRYRLHPGAPLHDNRGALELVETLTVPPAHADAEGKGVPGVLETDLGSGDVLAH